MTSAVSLGARVEDGKIEQGLSAVILEARRAREFGFIAVEFERVRRRVLASYERAVAERDKTDSGSYARRVHPELSRRTSRFPASRPNTS